MAAPRVEIKTSMGTFVVEVRVEGRCGGSAVDLVAVPSAALACVNTCISRCTAPQLYDKHAPRTCKNFLELARRGYYDGTVVRPGCCGGVC